MIEVVRKNIHTDMGNHFDDFSIYETDALQGCQCLVINVSFHSQNLSGEVKCNLSFQVV